MPTTSSRWIMRLGVLGRVEALQHQDRPRGLLRVLLALVADRLNDEQLRLALVQVVVEGVRHGRRQPGVLRPLEDERLAPLQHRFHELRSRRTCVLAFSTTSAPLTASTVTLLAGVADADAQPVALDQLAALVGDVVRHLGRVERAVDEPGERFDLREGPLRRRTPAAALMKWWYWLAYPAIWKA